MLNAFFLLLSPFILPYSLPEPAPLPVPLPEGCLLLACIMQVEDAPEGDDDKEDPYSILQCDWTEYDPTNLNHYPVSYLNQWGYSQTCPYIYYNFNRGTPTI